MLATITVTTAADNLIGDGLITLREAIQAANNDTSVDGSTQGSGNDIIDFAAALDGATITLTAGALPTITEGLSIDASALSGGLTIDASGSDASAAPGDGIRVFHFSDGNPFSDLDMEIHGLTVTGGDISGQGGAIRSQENLAISNSTISGNRATSDGGGIYVGRATLVTISNSLISGNSTDEDGGGIYGYNTTELNISNSTFSSNNADDDGGGVHLQFIDAITITASTVSGNNAGNSGGGGGIWLFNNAATTITNSTISGNLSDDDGGGIRADVGAGQTLTIQHSTITLNVSDANIGGAGTGGGIYLASGTGTATLENTIVAANIDNTTTAPDIDNTTNGTTTLNTSFTFVGTNTGSGLAAGGLIGGGVPIDPMLGPLSNNGGPTETHALLAGSPALNAGDPAFTIPPDSDQRGAPFDRLADGQLDIGAYERQTVAALNLVVDTLIDENDGDYSAGDLSLREAVGLANGSVGADTITFAPALNGGTISLVLGEIKITEDLTIDAASLASGIVVDASGNDSTPGTDDGMGSRVFLIDDSQSTKSTVELVSLNLTGGDADGFGGAILSFENLAVTDVVVSENHAISDGGGIFAADGDLAINSSTITGNSTDQDGGGVAFSSSDDSFSITDSTISDNTSDDNGGGVYVDQYSNSTISSSTISGNFAGGNGGGVYWDAFQGVSSMVNSTVSGNRADGRGGGILAYTYDDGDEIEISHSTITGNTSDDNDGGYGSGGGIFADGPGALTLAHTIVAGNTDNTDTAPDIDNTTDGATILSTTFTLIGNNLGSGLLAGGLIGSNAAPIDPLLGPLTDNGGPTLTHALLSGSPAIDAGDGSFAPPPTNDQRGIGFPRVLDGNDNGTATIDIGAFELELFIDHQGPRVTGVVIPDHPDYDLFDPKPSEDGPTPAIHSLSIGIEDLPPRPIGTVDPALVGATQVDEFEPNDSIVTAQALDGFFSLAPDDNIGDATQNTSTTIPHATVVASGDGTFDYYSFEVSSAGMRGIFDVDFTTNIDTELFLYDDAGNLLATDDDSSTSEGAGGSSSGIDSFLEFTFTSPGTYVIAVGEFNSSGDPGGVSGNPPDAGDSYTLQVSIEQHVLPLNPGFFRLEGDANGIIPIQNVSFAPDPLVLDQAATGNIVLDFFAPLPDDRYTLTLDDDIRDPAGNLLDGETNTIEPQEIPIFPSGDGVPGGDFVARFTVDSRAEIGTWAAGAVLVDTNGNLLFDPTNTDATNRDLTYRIGFDSDYIFAGRFSVREVDEDLIATGFDTIAAYGRVGNQYRWLIDTDDNGVVDLTVNDPAGINGYPVAGNFDGNPENGDEVGLFDGRTWHFDTDHDFMVDTSFTAFDYSGFPIAGDFDGDFEEPNGELPEVAFVDFDDDGDDDVATYIATSSGGNLFSVDINTAGVGSPIVIDGIADYSFQVGSPNSAGFGHAGVRERPVAADFNADGIDDFGLYVPDGIVPATSELGEWFLLISGDDPFTVLVETSVLDRIQDGPVRGFVPFSPEPFGNDSYAQFGNTFSLPIAGNFDPPVTAGPRAAEPVTAVDRSVSVLGSGAKNSEQTKVTQIEENIVDMPVETPILAEPLSDKESSEAVELQIIPAPSPDSPASGKTQALPSAEKTDEQAPEIDHSPTIVLKLPESSPQETAVSPAKMKPTPPEASLDSVEKQPTEDPELAITGTNVAKTLDTSDDASTKDAALTPTDPPAKPRSRSRVRSLSFGGGPYSVSATSQKESPTIVESSKPESAEKSPVFDESSALAVSVALSPATPLAESLDSASDMPNVDLIAKVFSTADAVQPTSKPSEQKLLAVDAAHAAMNSQEIGQRFGEVSDELAREQIAAWEAAANQTEIEPFSRKRFRSLHGLFLLG